MWSAARRPTGRRRGPRPGPRRERGQGSASAIKQNGDKKYLCFFQFGDFDARQWFFFVFVVFRRKELYMGSPSLLAVRTVHSWICSSLIHLPIFQPVSLLSPRSEYYCHCRIKNGRKDICSRRITLLSRLFLPMLLFDRHSIEIDADFRAEQPFYTRGGLGRRKHTSTYFPHPSAVRERGKKRCVLAARTPGLKKVPSSFLPFLGGGRRR